MSDVQAHMQLQNSLSALVRRLAQSGDTKALAKAKAALEAFKALNRADIAGCSGTA